MSTVTRNTPGPEDNLPAPDPPEIPGTGTAHFLRENLFKDTKNSILTVLFGVILAYVLYRSFGFVFSNQKLNPDGDLVDAWEVIRQPLDRFMVGTSFGGTGIGFEKLWAAIYIVAFTLGFASAPDPEIDPEHVKPLTWTARLGIVGAPLLGAIVLLSLTQTIMPKILTVLIVVPFLVGQRVPGLVGDVAVRRRGQILAILGLLAFLVETNFNPSNVDDFGGLLLTINVAFISIVLCFPIGVIMALMRRSSFPLLRPLAVLYIELVRGVPLITLLFMGQFAIRFFFPEGIEPPQAVIRAIIMFTLFSAAYVAEIVRGGLQSVPTGQTEAGQAVGLSPVTITARIVLPQALRNSIPALVGQFIALLKDTTLLIIIGLFDLLGVSDPILASPQFQNQGYAPEVYAFVAFIFWVMCFAMSRASQRLETKLGVGTR